MASRRRPQDDDDDSYSDEGSSQYNSDGDSYSEQQEEGSYSQGSYSDEDGSYYSDDNDDDQESASQDRQKEDEPPTPSVQSEYDNDDDEPSVSHSGRDDSYDSQEDDDKEGPPAFDTNADFGDSSGFNDFGNNAFGGDTGADAFGFDITSNQKDSGGFDNATFDDGFGFGGVASSNGENIGFGDDAAAFGFNDEKGFGGGDAFGFTNDTPESPLGKDGFDTDTFRDNGVFDAGNNHNDDEEEPSETNDSGREEDYSGRDQSSYSGQDRSGNYDDDEDQSYSDRGQSYSGQDHSGRSEEYSERDLSSADRDRDADGSTPSNREEGFSQGEENFSGRDQSSSERENGDFSGQPKDLSDGHLSNREDDFSQSERSEREENYVDGENSYSGSGSAREENYSGRDSSYSAHNYSDRDEGGDLTGGLSVSVANEDLSGQDYSGRGEDDQSCQDFLDDERSLSGRDHSEEGLDFSGRDHSERNGDYSGRDDSYSSRHQGDYSNSDQHDQDDNDPPQFEKGHLNEAVDNSYSDRDDDYSGNEDEREQINAPEFDSGDFEETDQPPDDYSQSQEEDSQQSYSQNDGDKFDSTGDKDESEAASKFQEGFDDAQFGFEPKESEDCFQEGFGDEVAFGFDTRAETPDENDPAGGFDGFGDGENFGFDKNASPDRFEGGFGDGGDFGFENKGWAADSAQEQSAGSPGKFDDFGFGDNQFVAKEDPASDGSEKDDMTGSDERDEEGDASYHNDPSYSESQNVGNEYLDPVSDAESGGGSVGDSHGDASIDVDDLNERHESPSTQSRRSTSSSKAKQSRKSDPRGTEEDDGSNYSGSEHRELADEDESIADSAYQTADAPFDGADTLADTLDENTGHTMQLGFDSHDNLDYKEGEDLQLSMSELKHEVEGDKKSKNTDTDKEQSLNLTDDLPPEEPTLKEKLESRPGRVTNYNRYSREQMMKLAAQSADGKKKKKQKKATELIEFVTDVSDVLVRLDEMMAAGETEPDSDSQLLLHGFECLVGIFLQLSDELDVMSTFAKSNDRAAMDALSSLLRFAVPVNEIFGQLRPVIEHYLTHETDEEMNDLLYGMNLMVDLLCDLSHKVGEKQEWNQRACTAYATLVELLSRDTLEVVSIYDDVDTPEYELSVEIEDAWNGTGHIEEFQTLEEAPDLAIFRQICYEVMLSTDKWCPDTETLMNICGIEDVMLDEASEVDDIDDSALAVTPESAIQVLDKINGEALRRPALLASVLRRVLPGQKIYDKSLAEHLSSIRSAMRSPLGLPASNLIGITSIPEVASDPNALGVAGMGKTTLAALVADHRDVRRHFVDGIAWVHLGQKELNYTRYIQCLRDLISQLEVTEEEEPAFPELLRTPGETGSQRRRREEGFLVFVRETMIAFLKKRAVLVVLDDVCFESDLDWFDFGAPSDNPDDEVSACVTLVTTRRRNLLPAADMVEVDMMEEQEAATLLVRESGDLSKSLQADSTETRSVVRECANHALAVKSVGRWLNLKHATSGEEGDPEQLHKDVVQSMERILKNGADDDADMMYEILNMSLSPAINGEPTSIIKFCFAAYVHVFCDKEYISEFALADATPIVPLGTVEMLFEAILGIEEETLMKDGSLLFAQKKDAAKLIPTALSSLGVFKVITTIAGADEDEEKTADAKEEKYLQIMHVVQQEYGEYLLDQDISLRDLGVDAEKRWNKAIAKAYLATKPDWDSDTPDASLDYFLEMMPVHLIRGEMLKDAASLLCNAAFVKGRLFALGRENGTRRHIKDCETLYDLLMKKKTSARKKYEPKATMRKAYDTLGDHLNMDEDEYIKEEGSPEAVEVGRCQFEIGFSLAEKRCWEAAIEHWEASQEILVSALGMVEVVAGILYNIGVVYTEMNEYEQALGSLKQCLRVRGTIHGEDHILYAQTIQRIGDVFLSMSDYHEAMESYNWALDVMHIEPSHHRIDIGDILENMGRIHFYKGESDDALQCFQDALQSKQTELREDHPELSSIYEHIGNCLSEQGKIEDAIAHLEEAIRLKQLDQFGGDETDAEVMTLEGVLSVRQGKQKAGLECYEKALQILVTKAPHRKEKIASLLHLVASVYLVSGENKKAMKLFEESLQARRKVLGFVHLDVASTLFSMAYLHQKRKRLDKALKCLEEALKIRQLRLPDSEKVAVTHEKIGTIARSIGKLKKAENAFSEALRIRKLIHGDNHPAVAKVMQDLGDLMDDLGEYEEAMKNYREAYRIRKSFGGDTLPVAETLYTIGFTYSNSGHYEKALECLDAALKIQRMHNGDDSPDCGDTLNMIGFLKAKCGLIDEAQECLRDALRIRKLQGDAIKISETLKNIGNAHRSKQEYRSAMETYQECLRIRQKELGREHDKVADALVAIGNIFADLSRPKEAMDAYQEALGIRARLFGDLDASLAPILQAMGMLDFYGNNYDRSLQLLNDYISIRNGNKGPRDGDYVNVLFTIGNIHQLRHDKQQAQKAWTEAYETFKDLGLAESNPEHAEQMEKLMRDHGLGAVVQESSQDDFPEEPVRHKKGGGMLKILKQKVKRGDGQNSMRRRKEKGQRL